MKTICLLFAIIVLPGCGGGSGEPAASNSSVTVAAGASRLFPPGALQAGDKVTCTGGEQPIGGVVPARGEGVEGSGGASSGGGSGNGVKIETKSDGSVLVVCYE
jgi:hypothetical protein